MEYSLERTNFYCDNKRLNTRRLRQWVWQVTKVNKEYVSVYGNKQQLFTKNSSLIRGPHLFLIEWSFER
jgi:hypothetical protein